MSVVTCSPQSCYIWRQCFVLNVIMWAGPHSERRLLAPSCLSACTRSAPAGWILVKFYIGTSKKIFRETPDLVPTWQKYWAPYIKAQVLLDVWQQKEISCGSTPVQRKTIIAFLWKNTTGFVLSIATMYANNDTKQRRCCFQLQQWLHERVTLSVTRTLPIFSVLMHETRMRVTKWLLGRHVVHTLHIIVVIAQQPLMGLGVIVVDVLRSYTDTPDSVGLLWTSDGPSQKPL